jgi:acetyl-CoA acetyltransferase
MKTGARNSFHETFILGVGMTAFVRAAAESSERLAQRAVVEAVRDAGVQIDDIDVIFVGHVFGGRVAGQRIAHSLGLEGKTLINVENACASGASALHLASHYVATGAADIGLALGFERLSFIPSGVIPPDESDLEGMLGRTNPATYALLAKRHMQTYGTTAEQLARVVVKARTNGALNERAQLRESTSIADVLASPVIAEPLTRLQCCPIGDGAAAAIVGRSKGARNASPRVVSSVVLGGLSRGPDDPMTHHGITSLTARHAYELAGLAPDDIDVAEVHDAFSIAEIVHIEDLGFCPTGEGGAYVEAGEADIGGRLPINPSGGLLARGHPLGASGLAQVFEIVSQLRGRAGERQVNGARLGLTHSEGGVVYGLDAGACAIHILAT